jgi:hypothetical protein
MGKASSSKKVARAARAGGRVSAGQPRSLLFPGVILAIIVLGIGLVTYAYNDRNSEDVGGPPQINEDHFHTAYGVNVCGEWKDPIPTFESAIGIHTHGDGVIHIHPFSELGVGANATLGRFFADAREAADAPQDVSVSDSKLTYLGEKVQEGKTKCKGVTDPVLRMAYWSDVETTDKDPKITTGDFGDLRLNETGGGVTLYYGDKKADIPKPPAAANLNELGAVDSASASSSTTAPAGSGSTSSSTPGATSSSTSTSTPSPG